MAVVAFIEPPQRDVTEKILHGHQSAADHRRTKLRLSARSVPVGGMWRSSAARGPPSDGRGERMEGARCSDGDPNELTYVDMDTFLATFQRSPTDVVSGTVCACRDRHAQSRRNDAWFANFAAGRSNRDVPHRRSE